MGVSGSRDDVLGVCQRRRHISDEVGLLVDLAVVHRHDDSMASEPLTENEMQHVRLLRHPVNFDGPFRWGHPYLSSRRALLRGEVRGPARFLALSDRNPTGAGHLPGPYP